MRLLKQKVNTFKGLGDEGFDRKEHYHLSKVRLKKTIKFMEDLKIASGSFLDVAGPSILGEKMAGHYRARYYHTNGDLDTVKWTPEFITVDVVLMMEVLEHLLNPLLFLRKLKERATFTSMVVTFPSRPSWLWTPIHFHEMRRDRFEYLCKLAGYEIIAWKTGRVPEKWYNKFRGIRPFFRYFVNHHYMALIKPLY
jgi:hypothetical protein